LALALMLLICSGLMVKAFWKLQEVHAGFDAERVLTMRLALPTTAYRDVAAVGGFYQTLEDRVNALPGVVSASIASGLPPVRPINANDTTIEGFVPVPNGPIQNVDYWNFVGPRYFDAIGAHLLEGRFLSPVDGASAPHESAVGHRVRTGGPNSPWRTVVGVVADMKNAGLDRPAGTELFIPYLQSPVRTAYLVLRTRGDPLSMMGAIRGQIRDLDRALPISQVRDMSEVMASARSRPRFLTMLLTLFSSVSLVLAALGIYGVISFSVAQRTNEIGVRMALGARSFDVVRLVGVAGIRLALAGTAIGALGAFSVTRTLSGLLFGVSSVDPLTFVAMAAMLIAVTLLACYIPARRASKVDPLIALRYE
jgi:putative ABC transport system permease protein